MSVFDQFNANPYIKMYAGAPIDEALEVGKIMQGRHDKALTDMQQHEYALSNIKGIGAADAAYRNKYAAELSAEFEKLAEAPEMAGQAINSLAAKYKQDPTLRGMATHAAAMKEWEEAYAKDPAKYGDVANYEMQKAVQQYNADGGAAGGGTFKAPALKELKDVNKFVRENAALIKSSSNGQFRYDEAKGSIVTTSGEAVSFERAQSILNAAVMGDPQMREQMQRQYNYSKEREGFKGSYTDFISTNTQGVAEASAFSKTKTDAKNWSNGGGSGAKAGAGEFFFTAKGADKIYGVDGEDNTTTSFESLAKNRKKRKRTDPAALSATVAENELYDNAVNAWASQHPDDKNTADFLRTVGIDGLPTKRETVYSQIGGDMGKSFTSSSYQLTLQEVTDYAVANNITGQELVDLKRNVTNAVKNIYTPEFGEQVYQAGRTSYETEYAPIENFNMSQKEEDAMNSVVQQSMGSAGSVTAIVNGEEMEYEQGEFFTAYDKVSVKSIEGRGSGTIVIEASRNGEQGSDMIEYRLPDGATDIRDYFEQLSVHRANKATNPKERAAFTRRALAYGSPQLVEQGARWDSEGYELGQALPLNTGSLAPIIEKVVGSPVNLTKDANGYFKITDKNGRNIFENNDKMTNLLKNSTTGGEATAVFLNNVRQQLASL